MQPDVDFMDPGDRTIASLLKCTDDELTRNPPVGATGLGFQRRCVDYAKHDELSSLTASIILMTYDTFFQISGQSSKCRGFRYDSVVGKILQQAFRLQKATPELLRLLDATFRGSLNQAQFYDGCVAVEIHDFRVPPSSVHPAPNVKRILLELSEEVLEGDLDAVTNLDTHLLPHSRDQIRNNFLILNQPNLALDPDIKVFNTASVMHYQNNVKNDIPGPGHVELILPKEIYESLDEVIPPRPALITLVEEQKFKEELPKNERILTHDPRALRMNVSGPIWCVRSVRWRRKFEQGRPTEYTSLHIYRLDASIFEGILRRGYSPDTGEIFNFERFSIGKTPIAVELYIRDRKTEFLFEDKYCELIEDTMLPFDKMSEQLERLRVERLKSHPKYSINRPKPQPIIVIEESK